MIDAEDSPLPPPFEEAAQRLKDHMRAQREEARDKTMAKAWAERQKGTKSMREIADDLGMDRLELIDRLEQWLKSKAGQA